MLELILINFLKAIYEYYLNEKLNKGNWINQHTFNFKKKNNK